MTAEELEDVLGLAHSSIHLPQLDQVADRFTHKSQQVTIIPTVHNEVMFSAIVTRHIREQRPDRILAELPAEIEEILIPAIDRLPLTTVVHDGQLQQKEDLTLTPAPDHAYIVHPGESIYWEVFLGRREGIPVEFMDRWHPQAYQTGMLPLTAEHLSAIGWTQLWEEGPDFLRSHLEDPIHLGRSIQMATALRQQLEEDNKQQLMIICGAAHWPLLVVELEKQGWDITASMIPQQVITDYHDLPVPVWSSPRLPEWQLADIHPHTIHLVTGQLPFYLGRFVDDPEEYDQIELIRELYFEAEKLYQQKFDEQISPSAYRRMFQYLRNLGRVQGRLLPDLYNLIAGAKGMVNDDYAFEVYRTAISYPFLPEPEQQLDQRLKFVPDESQGEVIRFAFRRRFKRPVLKKVGDDYDDLDPLPDEDYPGQWQEIWDRMSPYGYVSYPPEDEFIENYMQYLRKRIIEILQEEESSTMEFESSMEDGIDWRETMRHYHEGKIFVKKYPKNKYKVGALVVQFLEEPFDTGEYSHHSTLFAEHEQESHISVITTKPGDVIVGPGISRVKYAAIISQFPPVAMPYLISRENLDLKLRLIWSAMQMSLNKIIGFVAKKPPTAAQRHFAAEQGYRLVYLPMGQLTAQSLRRLRTMHLLAHRDLRDIAREYIGF